MSEGTGKCGYSECHYEEAAIRCCVLHGWSGYHVNSLKLFSEGKNLKAELYYRWQIWFYEIWVILN